MKFLIHHAIKLHDSKFLSNWSLGDENLSSFGKLSTFPQMTYLRIKSIIDNNTSIFHNDFIARIYKIIQTKKFYFIHKSSGKLVLTMQNQLKNYVFIPNKSIITF